MREEHFLYYSPVLLGLGIAVYFSLLTEPEPKTVFNIWLFCLASSIIAAQLYIQNPRFRSILILSGAVSLIVSGFYLAQQRSISVYEPMLIKPLKFAEVEGTIAEIDILSQKNSQRLIVKDLIIKELSSAETPYSIRVKVRGSEAYYPGQRISMKASLNPPSGPVAPGAFDFQRYAYFKKLGAVGFSYYPPDILNQKDVYNHEGFWESLRLFITYKITATLPDHLQGVAITFMTGEKSSISDNNLEAMRDSGLAHLLAISGLHVGLVAGFIFFFLRLGLAAIPSIALQYPIKKWAAGAALIAAFCYMLLVGASVPTQRAMMMTGIALFAIMIDRSPFSLRMVAIAALVILVSYPEALISASFQMSFAAVTALVAFYDKFRPQMQFLYREAGLIRKGVLYIAGIAVTTIIAGSATALYGMYHFQSWSLYSTLANVMAMPIVGMIVMPSAVLSYLLLPLGLGDYPLLLMGAGINQVLGIAHYVSAMEGAVLNVSAFSSYLLGLITLGIVAIIFGPQILRLTGAVILVLSFLLVYKSLPQEKIIVSDRGELVGFYNSEEQHLYISTTTRHKYVRDNWARSLGLTKGQISSFEEAPFFTCDSHGCRSEVKGWKIALARGEYDQQIDCGWADVLITSEYAPYRCSAPHIIDLKKVFSDGATEINLSTNDLQIKTVQDQRGERLWTQ